MQSLVEKQYKAITAVITQFNHQIALVADGRALITFLHELKCFHAK